MQTMDSYMCHKQFLENVTKMVLCMHVYLQLVVISYLCVHVCWFYCMYISNFNSSAKQKEQLWPITGAQTINQSITQSIKQTSLGMHHGSHTLQPIAIAQHKFYCNPFRHRKWTSTMNIVNCKVQTTAFLLNLFLMKGLIFKATMQLQLQLCCNTC